MADMLDRKNKHLFLEKKYNTSNSFIANVNELVDKLDVLTRLNGIITDEQAEGLIKLLGLHIEVLIEDLRKGTYLGSRKLDIDLLTNYLDYDRELFDDQKRELWADTSKIVYYDGATVYFKDGTSLSKTFTTNGTPTPIHEHHQLYTQLDEWTELKNKFNQTAYGIMPHTPIYNHELLRLWDSGIRGSTISSVVLHVSNRGHDVGYDAVYVGAKSNDPVFSWADSTSNLGVIANKIVELNLLANNIDAFDLLAEYLDQLNAIFSVLDELTTYQNNGYNIYSHLGELLAIFDNLEYLLNLLTSVTAEADRAKEEADKAELNANSARDDAARALACADRACECATRAKISLDDAEYYAKAAFDSEQSVIEMMNKIKNYVQQLEDWLEEFDRKFLSYSYQVAQLANASMMQTERINALEIKTENYGIASTLLDKLSMAKELARINQTNLLQTVRMNDIENELKRELISYADADTAVIHNGEAIPDAIKDKGLLVVLTTP